MFNLFRKPCHVSSKIRRGESGPSHRGLLDAIPRRERRRHRQGVHAGAQRRPAGVAHGAARPLQPPGAAARAAEHRRRRRQQRRLRHVRAVPEAHGARHPRQHHQPHTHVQALPALPHQVLEGLHPQSDACQDFRVPQGFK